ncbi:MAG: hypothetical protein COA70_03835 [Planctomycetota bacterium]|nr:MAG: hypothetical protein COA70_03835 [Planctomycetota bacterium]
MKKTIQTTHWAFLALFFFATSIFALSVQNSDSNPYWYAEATADHPSDTISILPPGGTGTFKLGKIKVNGKEVAAKEYTVQVNKGGIWVKFTRPLKVGDEVTADGSGPMSGEGTINIV